MLFQLNVRKKFQERRKHISKTLYFKNEAVFCLNCWTLIQNYHSNASWYSKRNLSPNTRQANHTTKTHIDSQKINSYLSIFPKRQFICKFLFIFGILISSLTCTLLALLPTQTKMINLTDRIQCVQFKNSYYFLKIPFIHTNYEIKQQFLHKKRSTTLFNWNVVKRYMITMGNLIYSSKLKWGIVTSTRVSIATCWLLNFFFIIS